MQWSVVHWVIFLLGATLIGFSSVWIGLPAYTDAGWCCKGVVFVLAVNQLWYWLFNHLCRKGYV